MFALISVFATIPESAPFPSLEVSPLTCDVHMCVLNAELKCVIIHLRCLIHPVSPHNKVAAKGAQEPQIIQGQPYRIGQPAD